MAVKGGKAKIRYAVACEKHGTEIKKGAGKQIIVNMKATKAKRKDTGCPLCISERTQGA